MKQLRKCIAYPFVIVGLIVLTVGMLIGRGSNRSVEALKVMNDAVKSLTKDTK